jgi:hypothetical protein
MEELCRCGHDKSEHDGHVGYSGCDGFVTDGNSAGSIGCYCSGYTVRTLEWEEEQQERSLKEIRRRWKEDTIWYKVRKFLGV